MELHFEVIRGKDSINAELINSQSGGYQLAICYNCEEKLIVKICFVMRLADDNGRTLVTLRSNPDDANTEVIISLDCIESIYPMHAFLK